MRQVNVTLAKKMCFLDVESTNAHNLGLLVLPLQGALNLRIKKQAFIVDSQQLVLLPPGCEHTYSANGQNESLVLYIPHLIYPTISGDEAHCLEMDARWRAIRFLILSEYQDNKADTMELNQLLQYCLQLIQHKQESPSISYIHKNYYKNILLEDLARLEHYHASYYSQWFVKKMGVTPIEYIQKVRLDKAKQLLRETNYSVFDIALQVGYEHQASLTRVFKQFESTTPSAYRHQFLK